MGLLVTQEVETKSVRPRSRYLRPQGSGDLSQNSTKFAKRPSHHRVISQTEQADEIGQESLTSDMQKLKAKWDMLDKEITASAAEGHRVTDLEESISLLPEYNDIKDVAQMPLGKLDMTRGVTIKGVIQVLL
ncbi:DNA repair protein SWI5 homolog [Psammomys obesus]|uniref:DNA repair protein SWI5 homolog n=1 Tax=Psammomys obesus TaxID=48139 RepID=UPI0024536D57|nr:DNA repair protein SWI5 homolog [Psammomys obesus]